MLRPSACMAARDALLLNTPTAPSGLQAAQQGSNAVALRWEDNSLTEASFEIYRSVNGGAYSLLASKSAGSTTHDDTGLTNGNAYRYYVTAKHAEGGESDPTSVAVVTIDTGLSTPDDAPTGLVATAQAVDGRIDLSWSNGSLSNSTGIQVYMDGALKQTESAGATSAQVTGLDDETEYAFKVRAVNADGESVFSNEDAESTRLAAPSDVVYEQTTKFHHFEWVNNSSKAQNVQILKSGVVYDTLGPRVAEYDVAIASEPTFTGSVKAIHSTIADSDEVTALA